MLRKLIIQALCKHKNHYQTFVRDIYGDEINLLDARSIWKCDCCGRVIYSDKLVLPVNTDSFKTIAVYRRWNDYYKHYQEWRACILDFSTYDNKPNI